jgi:ubiquinone/menaquinone biosynthesis C-methylase UbiE
MGRTNTEPVGRAYDRVAGVYDDLWNPHVAAPNQCLTDALALRPGESVADLACGTGLVTLDMARRVAPAVVEAVDCSAGMLASARARAAEAGLPLRLRHASVEDFVEDAPPGGYDVISLRFALSYFDWRAVVPRLGAALAAGGRVGILTSLSSSIPQIHRLYLRYRDSPATAWALLAHSRGNLPTAWRSFRQLHEAFGGEGCFDTAPPSAAAVGHALGAGGLEVTGVWTETVRLWFACGGDAVAWLRDSGYAAHPALGKVGAEAQCFVAALMAAGMEDYRETGGIPLDLMMGGAIARRPTD